MLILLAGLLHGIIVAFIIIIAINDNEPKASFEVRGNYLFVTSGCVLLLPLIKVVLFNISYFIIVVLLMLCVGFFFIKSNTESILTKY